MLVVSTLRNKKKLFNDTTYYITKSDSTRIYSMFLFKKNNVFKC